MNGKFGAALDNKSVLIVCGSGGVGKTTSAAAIAAQIAMRTEQKVLVITVDPARRLADALGVEDTGNDVIEIAAETLTVDGKAPAGRMFAGMLDAKASWDALVKRHAADADTAQRILSNKLYRNITERFVQSHDYIAMERLYELHQSGDYDLIIIDTPPVSHAIDFLEAPNRMADFFDSRLLKFLVAPSRSKFMAITSKPFLQIADRILGQRFLADISEFFGLLESMRPGFIERAKLVEQLINSEQTGFAVITTPEPAPLHEAKDFVAELRKRRLTVDAVVFNRVLPDSVRSAEAKVAAEHLRSHSAQLAGTQPADLQASAERVLKQSASTFERFATLAAFEEGEQRAFTAGIASPPAMAYVPWMSSEIDNIAALLKIGDKMWT